jgi:adenine-specific DNA-methyltransferase
MSRRTPKTEAAEPTDFVHEGATRKNIPPARIAAEGRVPRVAKVRYKFNPHLAPVLRFDPTGKADELETLIEKAGQGALSAAEQQRLRDALSNHQPWLEWTGKQEQHDRGGFTVDPVVLHIHERLSTRAIIGAAMREDVQRKLFADPAQKYADAVKFYKHDVDWANRIILGDALQVMSSLAQRERLAGKVQMIYIDPPYGIKFASNFQPEVGKRDVKEQEKDLARDSEVVNAFRDTWSLGVHTYLAYLRERLICARDLLTDSGSIFVQISDANAHRVRTLMDDIFGASNFAGNITVKKTGNQTSQLMPRVADYLLWFCKDIAHAKYRQLYRSKRVGEGVGSGERYDRVEESHGVRRAMTSEEKWNAANELPENCRVWQMTSLRSAGFRTNTTVDYAFRSKVYYPGSNQNWKTTLQGLDRLAAAERMEATPNQVAYVRYIDDFPAYPVTSLWDDTAGSSDKVYVVQTSPTVVERCMLMTTDPGDLVLDPTCGSGTTAYVAEQWGRRWITVDTSRVAVAIARQRLLTARFDHYKTKGASPASGFTYKTVPHITLKSIAQNTNLDPIFAKHQPLLDAALASSNTALRAVTADLRRRLAEKLSAKAKLEGKRALTDADTRRWSLPKDGFEHWTVPFDTDPDWPTALQQAVLAYRAAWRAKMAEVNGCIEKNAEQEELVDQPEVLKGVVRVSGPFTVEGVRPEELSLGEEGLFGLLPNGAEDTDNGFGVFSEPAPATYVVEPSGLTNLHAYLAQMVEHLRRDGVTFPNNKHRAFARLDALPDSGSLVHAEGAWEDAGNDAPSTVAVGFGPQCGPVTAQQVEELIRASRRYDDLVIAGFSFEADASAAMRENPHPRLRIHQAHIRPDINPAMDGLLKNTANSQLFSVFGTPEISVERKGESWAVELIGVDIYDPVANVVRSTKAEKVAAWFLDADFDGRCFCVTQAFFPDQDAWTKIARALKGSADPEAFDAFSGTRSVPFKEGRFGRIAVKVVDPRGNEVMTIKTLGR